MKQTHHPFDKVETGLILDKHAIKWSVKKKQAEPASGMLVKTVRSHMGD